MINFKSGSHKDAWLINLISFTVENAGSCSWCIFFYREKKSSAWCHSWFLSLFEILYNETKKTYSMGRVMEKVNRERAVGLVMSNKLRIMNCQYHMIYDRHINDWLAFLQYWFCWQIRKFLFVFHKIYKIYKLKVHYKYLH